MIGRKESVEKNSDLFFVGVPSPEFCSDKRKIIPGTTCHSKRLKFSLKPDSRQTSKEIM
jgi:hypothetical protein